MRRAIEKYGPNYSVVIDRYRSPTCGGNRGGGGGRSAGRTIPDERQDASAPARAALGSLGGLRQRAGDLRARRAQDPVG